MIIIIIISRQLLFKSELAGNAVVTFQVLFRVNIIFCFIYQLYFIIFTFIFPFYFNFAFVSHAKVRFLE